MEFKLHKLKKGKEGKWFAWCLLLMTKHAIEALATLKEEGLLFEGAGSFKLGKETYVIGMYDSKEEPVSANLNKKINVEHLEMKKECLEFVANIEIDYQFYCK